MGMGKIIIGIVVVFILVLMIMGYVKAPPDHAFIISGAKKEGKILTGRAGIRIPFLERMDKLYLGQITVDIKTEQSVPTNDFINVRVDAVAKVRIIPTKEGILLAAKNFLNKRSDAIAMELQDTLQGNMREIIGTLTLKEINTNRDAFSDQVMQKASKDMEKLGIEILSCNIQNVTDDNDLIKDLGADNTSQIKKDAEIAKAQAKRDVAIAQAEADRVSNEARVKSDTEIAQRQNELEIKKAELKRLSDTKKAEADAAYEIQKQEQRKTIEATSVNADIVKTEREAELKAREVDVKKKSLDAEIRAKADADRYQKEQQAEAALFQRQKEAEAKRFEEEQQAEAEKARAEAAKFAKLQEAEGIAAVGKAEADAILAKEVAEAKGLDQKAEAMKKYGEAAVTQMIVDALPEIAKNIAAPLAKVDKITMYGEGNTAKLMEDIVKTTNQVTGGMMEGMGINLPAMLAGFLGGKAAGNDKTVIVDASGTAKVETPEEDPAEMDPES